MDGNKQNRKSSKNQNGSKGNKKTRQRRPAGNQQVPLSPRLTITKVRNEPSKSCSDLPDQLENLSLGCEGGDVTAPSLVPTNSNPRPQASSSPVVSTIPIAGSSSSKKKETKSDDAAAFDLEEAEEKDKRKQSRGKATSEDAFAEFESLTGISLNATPSELCLRPAFKNGRLGEKVALLTNFFRLKLKGNDVHQYDIAFLKPDESAATVVQEQEIGRKFKRIAKRMNQSLLLQFAKNEGADLFRGISYAYDNERILITNSILPGITREGKIFRFEMPEVGAKGLTMQPYKIQIKKTVDIKLAFGDFVDNIQNSDNNRALLQVLDIICKTHAFQNDIIYGSKIFFSAEAQRRIPMGRQTLFELAFGYHQSAQLCQGGPMLNIDRATAVLFKAGPLIDAICTIFKVNSPSAIRYTPNDLHTLDELILIKIETTYRGYTKCQTIRSFSPQSLQETYLTDSKISIIDYFSREYSINLRYPNLPCIMFSEKNYVPVELCTILPNQRNQRKLRDELIAEVSKHTTRQKPAERLECTSDFATRVSQQLADTRFDIRLDPGQVTVQSRIIRSPKLHYYNAPNFEPLQGNWDMSRKQFLTSASLNCWAFFNMESRKIDGKIAGHFVKRLKETGNELGMKIENPSNPYKCIRVTDLEKTFKDCASNKVKLIMFIIPEVTDYYNQIKYFGDRFLGIPTQVVLDKHYDNRNQRGQKLFDTAYLSNLLLKINTKIGGVNLKISDSTKCPILTKKTMVVGIDVNHPSPGEKTRSIAAVVGSIDDQFMKYRTEIQANQEREELVRVDEMLVPIITKFKRCRGFYPDHIIVYRDGVSEGQFAHVMGHEILPLSKKLATLSSRPKLTYIIVQKRHNARFYPTDSRKATKSGNILPGTVIDTDVVHYKWFDFYLCSQNSFLGTARPGKYTVLWNSSPAQADDLQMATYYLCYLFARSTKSIADPAPARYAHHAAARGKIIFKEISRQNNWTIEQINANINSAINVNEDLANVLYFI